jgi:hypothetical protein
MGGMDTLAALTDLLASMDQHIADVEAEAVEKGDVNAERRRSMRLAELRYNRGHIQWKINLLLRELDDGSAKLYTQENFLATH